MIPSVHLEQSPNNKRKCDITC